MSNPEDDRALNNWERDILDEYMEKYGGDETLEERLEKKWAFEEEHIDWTEVDDN